MIQSAKDYTDIRYPALPDIRTYQISSLSGYPALADIRYLVLPGIQYPEAQSDIRPITRYKKGRIIRPDIRCIHNCKTK
jgi:hypothetical protein